jgi:zinc protease
VKRGVPEVGLDVPRLSPRVTERVLANGLRVLAVRKPGVPLAHLRLHVPFAGRGAAKAHSARAELLSETMLLGTAHRTGTELNEALESLGGELSVGVSPDELVVSGSVLSAKTRPFLALLREILTEAAYPSRAVMGERDTLIQKLAIARSQPQVAARKALVARLFGEHPYGRDLPEAEDVERVTPASLRSLHARGVVPDGAILVVVGDVRPGWALDSVEAALAGWRGRPAWRAVSAPRPFGPGPVILVDRPGAAQTNIRMGGPAVLRSDPSHAALELAQTVFGGYFSSRLVANIRERNGYSYSPRSGLEHRRVAAHVIVSADVGTEVTAPALAEMWYELARIGTRPIEAEELESARHYTIGVLALATSSQSGLASTLARVTVDGIGPEYLRTHPQALSRVSVDEVFEASRRHLAPARLVTVLVGDAERIGDAVQALTEVTVTPG